MNSRVLDLFTGLDAYLSDLYEASIAGLFNRKSDLSSEETKAVHALLSSCHETEKSVIALLRNGFVFDADSLMRSVAEGSVRVLYMLSGSIDCVKTRIKEYSEELPLDTQKNLRKRAVSISDQKNISDEEYQEMLSGIERMGSSGTPKEISGRWTFANLFKQLKSETWGNVRLSRIQVLYALQSDFLHKGYLTCQLRQESNAADVGIISRHYHPTRVWSCVAIRSLNCVFGRSSGLSASLTLREFRKLPSESPETPCLRGLLSHVLLREVEKTL